MKSACRSETVVLVLAFFITCIYFFHVYVSVYPSVCAHLHTYGGQRTTSRSRFSHSAMWSWGSHSGCQVWWWVPLSWFRLTEVQSDDDDLFFSFFSPRPFFHFLSCLKSFNFMHCLCVCGVLVVLPYHFSPYSFEAGFLTAPGLRVKASKPWQFFHLCPLWLWRTGVHALTFEFLHACWDSNPDPRVCTLCTLTH